MSKPKKSHRFYRFFHRLFAKFLLKIYKVHTYGMENIPDDKGFLLCPNHISNLDAVLLCASFPKQVHFLSKAEVFKVPIIGGFCRAIEQIPIHRGAVDLTAIKTAISYLQKNEIVGIFPQGHRCKKVHPKNTEIKDGIAMLARRSGAPILPVAICTRKMKFHAFGRIDIYIGKPTQLNWDENLPNAVQYKTESQRIFDMVCSLTDFDSYLGGNVCK